MSWPSGRRALLPELLLKDFDLGFDAARGFGVPMPVAAAAAELVCAMQ